MKHILLFTATIFTLQLAISQTNPEVLMKIDSKEISKDEFLRIYNKNKSIAEDHQKSIDEYIDLFINYKLKVLEAENLGYDTMSSFIEEMDNYTTQLTDSYLENDEKLDSMVVEAYKRSLEEISGKHILFQISYNSLPQDTIKVYDSIMKVRAKLVAGEPFEKVLDEATVDPNHKVGGNLGWFSAFRMVYPFEIAAYNLPIGEVSMPIRTNFGYHLIIIDGHRKNRGLIEASHIMTVFPKNASDLEKETAEQKIDSAYSELQQGTEWNAVARKYSEHLATSGKGGYLGWLGSKNAPAILLDSCFAIDSGTYSQPFLSSYGYHIVKRHANKPVPPFEEVKEEYKNNMRHNILIKRYTQDQIINNIKNEYGFEYFEENLDTIYNLLDSNIYKYKWNPAIAKNLTKPVFTIGDKNYTQYEFAKYISKQRKNINVMKLDHWFYKRVPEFIETNLIEYERSKLPEKYPELKYLLEEYHDGILLFNLTENEVWTKAIEDTTGLEKFYEQLPEKYSWDERVSITKYSYTDSLLTTPLLKLAKAKNKKKLTADQIITQICTDNIPNCIKIEEVKYEKGDNSLIDAMAWKKGEYLASKDKYNYVLYYVNGILPAQIKKLDDARGLYTADYQSFLEKEWVEKLRTKYAIEINEELLEKIKSEND